MVNQDLHRHFPGTPFEEGVLKTWDYLHAEPTGSFQLL